MLLWNVFLFLLKFKCLLVINWGEWVLEWIIVFLWMVLNCLLILRINWFIGEDIVNVYFSVGMEFGDLKFVLFIMK